MNLSLSLIFMLIGGALTGCRSEPAPAAPAPDRLASLERGLDRQREMDAYIKEVDAWSTRIVADAAPEDHDGAEATAANLQAHIRRVKTQLARTRSDRFVGWTPALAAASRELDDLKDAHYRALSGYPPERRMAEKAMSDSLEGLGTSLTDFRLEVSSFSATGNAEVKRRIASLERGRKEMSDILKDLSKADTTNWPYLKRRWDRKMTEWEDDRNTGLERLHAAIK